MVGDKRGRDAERMVWNTRVSRVREWGRCEDR